MVAVPTGYASTGKQGGVFISVQLGAGVVSFATAPMRCLLSGMKLGAGSATVAEPYRVTSEADADTLFGAGSELARMCYRALAAKAQHIEAIATAEPGAGVQATVTATVSGTWTTGGVYYLEVDGDLVGPINVGATASTSDVATAIAAAVTARSRLAMTAGASGAVATLTRKNKGARGNDGSVYHDTSQLPSGCVVTLAGSASLPGGGVRPGATAGTGVDDVTSVLTAIYPERYHRIGAAQSDATQAAQWETHVNNAAALGEQRYQAVHVGFSGTLSAATSFATTTANNPRVYVLYQRSNVAPASEIAAEIAAIRTVDEADYINTGYDGRQLAVPGQKLKSDHLSGPEIRTALAAGVSPIETIDGKAVLHALFTSKTLTSSLPDDRCDTSNKQAVPDFVADAIAALWAGFKTRNPVVRDDTSNGQPRADAGVATPSIWNAQVNGLLKDLERTSNGRPGPILSDVDAEPPVSAYDEGSEAIISAVHVKPARLNRKTGITVLGI